MDEPVRWSLKASRDTDVAPRTLLATRGGRKGDLSRLLEAAVNREAPHTIQLAIPAKADILRAHGGSSSGQEE